MRYRLNNDSSKTVVEVLNLDSSNEFKLIEQLKPFIIITDEQPNYYITIQSGDENVYSCNGNCLNVVYATNNFLFKTVRQAIRDIIYYSCLENGYIKFHAASVNNNNSTTMIMGYRNTGKTSLALGLAKYCGYSIIDGDLTLVKGTSVLGWQTALGLRRGTADALGFKPKENSEFTWLWPNQLESLGYRFDISGNVENIVIPKFDFGLTSPVYREISVEEKRQLLLNNIHYIEMNKVNYWNKQEFDIFEQIASFLKNNDIIGKRMIEFECAGINQGNARVLSDVLKG